MIGVLDTSTCATVTSVGRAYAREGVPGIAEPDSPRHANRITTATGGAGELTAWKRPITHDLELDEQ